MAEIGFVWNARDHNFEELFHALRIFQKFYGHLYIPQRFVVPGAENTPPTTAVVPKWARPGNAVTSEQDNADIENYNDREHSNDNDIVDDNGFGDLESNRNSWPEHLKGYKLGTRAQNLRMGRTRLPASVVKQLDSLDFPWQVKLDLYDFDEVRRALELFKQRYGHLDVPVDWSVHPDDFWPGNWGQSQ